MSDLEQVLAAAFDSIVVEWRPGQVWTDQVPRLLADWLTTQGWQLVTRGAVSDATVREACEAIYRRYEGHWPSDAERDRIRVALEAYRDA